MSGEHSTGDPIPEVFDLDRTDARFVVAMSMARNDIEVALRDGIAAAHDDRPDFAYRVRLVTSHLSRRSTASTPTPRRTTSRSWRGCQPTRRSS
jgi:hypothetical protein